MTSKLASLAGANKLSGAVCITDRKGVTHKYASTEAAEEAWEGKLGSLTHKRGAFYEKAAEKPKTEVMKRDAPVTDKRRKKRS